MHQSREELDYHQNYGWPLVQELLNLHFTPLMPLDYLPPLPINVVGLVSLPVFSGNLAQRLRILRFTELDLHQVEVKSCCVRFQARFYFNFVDFVDFLT